MEKEQNTENEIYHKRQKEHIYRSTEVFVKWLEEHKFLEAEQNILDMACGCGANAMYMANKFQDSQFVGMDINEEFINYENIQVDEHCKYGNCRLLKGDWFNQEPEWISKFDGIISFQTLLMFPDYKEALNALVMLQPKWIALSSLFYEGNIEYTNKFRDFYRPSDGKEYRYQQDL